MFQINTLGFRGEALASISSVSEFSLITKQEDGSGVHLLVSGGQIINQDLVGANKGTTIEVRNLFFNTPARVKFLKTDAVELRHIIEVVTRYALINSSVSFRLSHEGHTSLLAPAVDDLRSNLAAIWGTKLAKGLLEINEGTNEIKIRGFISKPYDSRNDKNQQALFVNSRWVRSLPVVQAIYDALKSLLFVGKHPVFLLWIELDPKKIDVNVHPEKTEIKIEQQELVCEKVKEAIMQTMQKNNLVPIVEFDHVNAYSPPKYVVEAGYQKTLQDHSVILSEERLHDVVLGFVEESIAAMHGKNLSENLSNGSSGSLSNSSNEVLSENSNNELNENSGSGLNGNSSNSSNESLSRNLSESLGENSSEISGSNVAQDGLNITSESSIFPSLKLLNQFDRTFFIAETNDGIYFIDQHASCERVMYEKFMQELFDQKVEKQTLLESQVVDFSSQDTVLVNEHINLLLDFGFELEHFEGNSFLLKTSPLIFERMQPKDLLLTVVNSLSNLRVPIDEIKEKIIARMACHSSFRAGENLTIAQGQELMRKLSLCKNPFTCAHGRPTMIKTTRYELEKKFKRC